VDKPNAVDRTPDIGSTLTDTLKNSELRSLAPDLVELPFDSALPPGIVRDIPILRTLDAIWRTTRTVRDYIFAHKILKFLGALADIPPDRRRAMIERLEVDEQFGKRIGEQVIVLLDHLDSIEKATLIGRAFRAYCEGHFNAETLQRVNFAIDRVMLLDLARLADFRHKRRGSYHAEQAFVNAGLGYIPHGMATVQVLPVEPLCDALLHHVLA
jgi:hypothetical protein